MSLYLEDKDLVAFFLRTVITDPKGRVTLQNSDTQNIITDKIVSVTSTASISHPANVKLDGSPLTAFVDYLYDIKNQKLLFFEFQTGELTFDVYGGTNWIHPGPTRKEDLKKSSFPRITTNYTSRPTTITGNFDACEITNNRIQVDVWTKKDYIGNINIGGYNSSLSDDKLAMYLAKQVKNNLKSNGFDLTAKYFRDYIPIDGPKLNDYVPELDLYNVIYEFFIKSIDSITVDDTPPI